MLRRSKSEKLNNGGFSLVEVLVAMFVIAVISIPLVRGFVTSAKFNAKARRLQNATDMAQNIAEVFGSEDMDKLLSDYDYTLSNDVAADTRTYTFTPFAATGAGNEKFTVKVSMTSSNDGGYEIPVLKNFFGNEEVVCVREITKYDNIAVSKLGVDASAIHKTVDVTVTTNVDGSYQYTCKVTYSGGGSTFGESNVMTLKKGSIVDEDTGEMADEFPTLYILYEPYTYNSSTGFCSDNINISYESDDTTVNPVTVFLVPQGDDETTIGASALQHVNVTYNGGVYSDLDNNCQMTYILYDGNTADLTQGHRKAYVYDVDIQVVYKGDVLTHITSTREDVEEGATVSTSTTPSIEEDNESGDTEA